MRGRLKYACLSFFCPFEFWLREADFVFRTATVPNGSPKSLDEIEKAHILRTLELVGWNQTRAAEILSIDRVTLHHKLKRYGWSKPTVQTR